MYWRPADDYADGLAPDLARRGPALCACPNPLVVVSDDRAPSGDGGIDLAWVGQEPWSAVGPVDRLEVELGRSTPDRDRHRHQHVETSNPTMEGTDQVDTDSGREARHRAWDILDGRTTDGKPVDTEPTIVVTTEEERIARLEAERKWEPGGVVYFGRSKHSR